MDYSKLSDNDLLALQSGDYSKLSDEALMALKETPQPEQSLPQKAWDALGKPAEMSKQGLTQIAESLPETGNTTSTAANIAIGTPRVLAETVAEVAPSFVDKASILTAGAGLAAKGTAKAVGAVLPKVAPAFESLSGLPKGTLVKAFEKPLLMFKGKSAEAQAIYETTKKGLGANSSKLVGNAKYVENALSKLKKGTISGAEAFQARKSINQLMKSDTYPKDLLQAKKDVFEKFLSSSVKKADKLYKEGIDAEKMRSWSPLTSKGKPNTIKQAAMHIAPKLIPVFSPAVQSGLASGAGAIAKIGTKGIVKGSGITAISSKALEELAKKRRK